MSYILSIDQGTTGTTALLVDKETLSIKQKSNYEFNQIFPKPGWVEHDLNDIWKSVEQSVTEVISNENLNPVEIETIGITNQRETICAFNKKGKPLCKAIVWQDRRTSEYCRNKEQDYQKLRKITGLPLDPYFSATKMRWMLDNIEAVKEAKDNNDLLFGTIDTYLLYRLTNTESFKTEVSNASRTLLMNLETCQWDPTLLSFFDISSKHLPEICDSFCKFGQTKALSFLPDNINISCILGDQQAALFGQSGWNKGSLKCTYGTGAFILLNTAQEIVHSQNGLLTTVAYSHKGKACYALEGSSFIAGAAVQWIRDNLNFIDKSEEIEKLALKASDEDTLPLIFFPFFNGIGSPYWVPDAKGAILGITRGTDSTHLSRACLDGVALSINDSIRTILSDFSEGVQDIRVDGGACMNNFLMQMQSNFSQFKIVRPQIIETTAYGVALGALIGIDAISFDDISNLWRKDREFKPQRNEYYQSKLSMWKEYIDKVFL